MTVSADRAGLPEGESQGEVTVSWAKGTVPISVTASRETPPVIGAVSILRPVCGANGLNLVITVPIDDESGVESAVVAWSGPGSSGSTALTSSGNAWVASIGPFARTGGQVQVDVTATDTRGNQARRGSTLTAAPCPN